MLAPWDSSSLETITEVSRGMRDTRPHHPHLTPCQLPAMRVRPPTPRASVRAAEIHQASLNHKIMANNKTMFKPLGLQADCEAAKVLKLVLNLLVYGRTQFSSTIIHWAFPIYKDLVCKRIYGRYKNVNRVPWPQGVYNSTQRLDSYSVMWRIKYHSLHVQEGLQLTFHLGTHPPNNCSITWLCRAFIITTDSMFKPTEQQPKQSASSWSLYPNGYKFFECFLCWTGFSKY